MKKSLFLSAMVFVLASVTHAQTSGSSVKTVAGNVKRTVTINKKEHLQPLKKLPGTEVSPVAKQAFAQIYGNTPAVWKRTSNYDEVTFTAGGEEQTSYYDADAKLVGTIIQKKFEDLPDESQKYINEKYQGYKKEDVVFYNDNELNTTDIVLFNKQFEDYDCYYVKLKKADDEILVKVKQTGEVLFFKSLR